MMRKLWVYKRDGVIALAILLILFLFIVTVTLMPLFSQIDDYRSELMRDARALQQLRAIDGARDDLESSFKEYQDKNLQTWVYSQERADTVTLDIQRRVSAELVSASAQVKSTSPLRAQSKDGYSLAGVQVNFSASMPALMQVLSRLENDKPLLVLDDIRISPSRGRGSLNGEVVEQQLVDIQMTVLTFLVAEDASGVEQ